MAASFLPAAHWSFLTRYYEALAYPFARRIWKRVLDETIRLASPGATIVDLGCGPGTVLRKLGQRRADLALQGIDIDPYIIGLARERDRRASTVYSVTSIGKLPMPDASVDMAISTLMFHHLDAETQRAAFQEVQRVLKPGGMFLLCDFSVPQRKWLTPIAALILRIEASAPLQLRGQLFTLTQERHATIKTLCSFYGCISLHTITFSVR